MKTLNTYQIDFDKTGYFSKLAIDIVAQNKNIEKYISQFASPKAILEQISKKKKQKLNRSILVQALEHQYRNIKLNNHVKKNISLLQNQNTFTICTAHQPCIFGGPLYFIYKITHVIKISIECNQLFQEYHFVPVFYMGTEDNDIDEIGSIYFNNQKIKWETDQRGACGRMSTKDLKTITTTVLQILNLKNEDEQWLFDTLQNAFNNENTLADATRIWVNALFEKYGLVIVDADDILLKKEFENIISDELFNQTSHQLIQTTLAQFNQEYQVQAQGRTINIFYLSQNIRERIEKNGTHWKVLNSEILFDEIHLKNEIKTHPERFSPNVILRPLLQETLLPNILFLGGGGELAYWLELKNIFNHYQIPYPIVMLRNSFLLIDEKTSSKRIKAKLSIENLFKENHQILKENFKNDESILNLNQELETIEKTFLRIEKIASKIGTDLQHSMQAHHAKYEKIKLRIYEKFYARLKKNHTDKIQQIELIKNHLFPNHQLQERTENFIPFFKTYGKKLTDILINNQNAFDSKMIILEQSEIKTE